MNTIQAQRDYFPGNEPVYISLIVIVILSYFLFMLYLYFTFKGKIKCTFNSSIILNLLCVNFLNTNAYLLNYSFFKDGQFYLYFDNDNLCEVQSFLTIFTSLSRDIWVVITIFVTFQSIVNSKKYDRSNLTMFLLFCLGSYIFPLLITILYGLRGLFGVSDFNCWIKIEKSTSVYAFLLYFIKWICVSGVVYFSFRIIKNLIGLPKDNIDNKTFLKQSIKMLSFPFILVVSNLIPFFYTFLSLCSVSISKYYGAVVVIVGGIQGILYPLCYLINSGALISICQKNTDTDNESEGSVRRGSFSSEQAFALIDNCDLRSI